MPLKGHLNTQSNSYCSANNPRLIHEVPIRDITVGVWCAVCATCIMRPVSLNTINSEGYNGQFLLPYLGDEIEYIFFQPACETTLAANNSLSDIRFGQRIICRPLWSIRSPDLTPCHFSKWMIQTTFIRTTHTFIQRTTLKYLLAAQWRIV